MNTKMRQAIARYMVLSKQTIPHYYLTRYVDISNALIWRAQWNKGREKDSQASINDLILKATSLALEKHPQFNGYFLDNSFQCISNINIGIAISLPDGLIAPAILNCQSLSMDELVQRRQDLIKRAKDGKLKSSEYNEGTFTISNLGMYHVDIFTAIIIPPQVSILAVGAVNDSLICQDGKILVAQRIALTLSADHRVTDGAEGALFLGEIIQNLQQDYLFNRNGSS